jgi:hypothetical protein
VHGGKRAPNHFPPTLTFGDQCDAFGGSVDVAGGRDD